MSISRAKRLNLVLASKFQFSVSFILLLGLALQFTECILSSSIPFSLVVTSSIPDFNLIFNFRATYSDVRILGQFLYKKHVISPAQGTLFHREVGENSVPLKG